MARGRRLEIFLFPPLSISDMYIYIFFFSSLLVPSFGRRNIARVVVQGGLGRWSTECDECQCVLVRAAIIAVSQSVDAESIRMGEQI